MDTCKLNRFTELKKARELLEEEMSTVIAEMATLEAELLGEFEREGVQNVKINGSTVYLHRQLWAKARDGDYARACGALRAVNLDELVQPRFNTQSVSAWIREQEQEGKDLPPEIKAAFEIEEKYGLRIRKGA